MSGTTPGRARRVALLDATEGGSALVRALLDDLAEALTVYERLSARELGDAGAPLMEARWVKAAAADTGGSALAAGETGVADASLGEGTARPGVAAQTDAATRTDMAACPDATVRMAAQAHADAVTQTDEQTRADMAGRPDTEARPGWHALVVGLDARAAMSPSSQALASLARLANGGPGRTGSSGLPVYAVIATEGDEPARTVRETLERVCQEAGGTWCGALVAEGADLLALTMRTARMGTLRRNVSEATDRLIADVRLGCTVAEGARTFFEEGRVARAAEQGLIVAMPPLPRAVCRLLARIWPGGRSS